MTAGVDAPRTFYALLGTQAQAVQAILAYPTIVFAGGKPLNVSCREV